MDLDNIITFLITNGIAIFTSFVFVLYLIYQWRKRPKNFPPGPNGLPILGVLHKLGARAEISLMKMSNKYGPIMGVKLLRNFTVVLSDLDSIQQAFVKQGNAFSGRPNSGIFHLFTGGTGVLAIDGPRWKENRKFGTAIMRKLGAGKKIMEERIVDEMICMTSALQIIKGKPFDISNLVMHSVANVVCSLAFGERFDYNDLEFIAVARSLIDWFAKNGDAFLLLIFAPYLQSIPPFRGVAESLKESTDKLYTLLLPIIEEHREIVNSYEYRDFIDAYLLEIEKQQNNPDSMFTEEDLKGTVRDLFVAGTDTTATAIKWSIVFLINRPNVQKKIQKEIDRVIGPDARPKMVHLDEMHFTKSFIHEMLRYRTPGPLGLVHRTVADTVLKGYNIPKNTQVMANFWAVHFDPKLWDKPEEFRPDRFLDENGKFKKSPYILSFSLGTRYCMGEGIARMEYFLFLVVTLQRFHLKPVSPDAPPLSEECVKRGSRYKTAVTRITGPNTARRLSGAVEFYESLTPPTANPMMRGI